MIMNEIWEYTDPLMTFGERLTHIKLNTPCTEDILHLLYSDIHFIFLSLLLSIIMELMKRFFFLFLYSEDAVFKN